MKKTGSCMIKFLLCLLLVTGLLFLGCPPPADDNGTGQKEPEEKDKTNYIILSYNGETYEVTVSQVDTGIDPKIEYNVGPDIADDRIHICTPDGDPQTGTWDLDDFWYFNTFNFPENGTFLDSVGPTTFEVQRDGTVLSGTIAGVLDDGLATADFTCSFHTDKWE